MTTGRNLMGELTNDGQQISRLEALRLYTEGAAWFSFDDHHIGSFHDGKHPELAVLSHDYLWATDATIRRIEPVLTMAGGRIVYAAAPSAPEVFLRSRAPGGGAVRPTVSSSR